MQLVFLNPLQREYTQATLTLSPDQFYLVYSGLVIITAVIDDDPANHTLLWEQIGGTPNGVDIVGGNVTSLELRYYNNVPPGAFDTKVWKFTVDGGTPVEVSGTVEIVGSAITKTYLDEQPIKVFANKFTMGSTVADYFPILSLIQNFNSFDELGSSEPIGNTMLSWTVSPHSGLIEFLITKRVAGNWVQIETTQNQYSSVTIELGYEYQVAMVVREVNSSFISYQSNIVYNNDESSENFKYNFARDVITFEAVNVTTFMHDFTNFIVTIPVLLAPPAYVDEQVFANTAVPTFGNFVANPIVTIPILLGNSQQDDITVNNNLIIKTPLIHPITNYTVTLQTGNSIG